jgi:hypothetical protein
LISWPAEGGAGLKTSAHKLPRLELIPVSTSPPWLKVAAGLHPGVPRLPRKPPAGAVRDVVASDDCDGEPQAAASTRAMAMHAAFLRMQRIHP